MAVGAFPYDAWPRLDAESARQSRRDALRCRLAARRGHRVDGVRLASLTRSDRRAAPVDPEPCAALLLDGPSGRAGLILDARFASAWVERTLGTTTAPLDTPGALGAVARGVLAYGVARWLAGTGLRVVAVWTRRPTLAAALAQTPLTVWSARLELDAETGAATYLEGGDRASPGDAPASRWSTLRRVPIRCAVEAGQLTMVAAQLAALRPGDALIDAAIGLSLGVDGPSGPVTLRAGRGGPTALARLAGRRLLIEATWPNAHIATRLGRPAMKDDDAPRWDRTGGLPVEVRLELAQLELTVEELARLAPGEVLSTGRPIGRPVVLRAGDVVVAEGELVDVDGDVGIRITSLAD